MLDGHSVHVKNLKAIELARKENVIMLCLPPHTTHKIQPLDRTLFKPLQTYYDQAAEQWLRTHVGRVITPYQLCGLFNEAYCKAATMATAINCFARCGIWPCNRDVFAESEFHASFSNTRDQSTSFAEAPSTGTTSQHTTAPTAGTYTHQTTAPTAGASTHQSTARTAGVPTHQTTAPTAGAPTRQYTAPTAGAPTHQSAAPTAVASSEQCAFESIGTLSQPASTPTQATEQHYTTAPLSETIDLSPCESHSVYSTKPDGRCFFRSVVVALEPTLQVDRDNGSLHSPILMLQETCKASALRSNVIEHCLQQYDSLSDLMTGDGLNADMPSHIRYTCLHDRLNAMADPTSMVGELEISQTAEVLNKTIKIVNKDSDNVLTYGEEFADPMPISLLYTPLGDCAGHYDTLRKSNPSEQLNRIPCSPVLGLSLPTLPPKQIVKGKEGQRF